jgi:mRNA interferase MazF
VYSRGEGLITEVAIGPPEGLKHPSVLRCDEVTGLRRTLLRDYVGSLSPEKLREVNRALAIALDIDPDDLEDL